MSPDNPQEKRPHDLSSLLETDPFLLLLLLLLGRVVRKGLKHLETGKALPLALPDNS